jgi:hypothetical protein
MEVWTDEVVTICSHFFSESIKYDVSVPKWNWLLMINVWKKTWRWSIFCNVNWTEFHHFTIRFYVSYLVYSGQHMFILQYRLFSIKIYNAILLKQQNLILYKNTLVTGLSLRSFCMFLYVKYKWCYCNNI